MLVQVIKEGLGTKGPTLSTYISIPGRYLVLMPALRAASASVAKIEDEIVHRRLRDIMLELKPPRGVGFIVRTAGSDRTKRELLARHGLSAPPVERRRGSPQSSRPRRDL